MMARRVTKSATHACIYVATRTPTPAISELVGIRQMSIGGTLPFLRKNVGLRDNLTTHRGPDEIIDLAERGG